MQALICNLHPLVNSTKREEEEKERAVLAKRGEEEGEKYRAGARGLLIINDQRV